MAGVGMKLDSKLIAELLDQDEYPSNIGEVAAISDRQICFLRRDWDELTHFRLEYFDVLECRAIEYQKETAYYRLVAGITCLIAAVFFLFLFVNGLEELTEDDAPFVVGAIIFGSLGFRFVTSLHRHVIHFEMPGEVLTWRSPPTDFEYKADAARAVREYARERGILRAVAGQ